MTQPPLRAVIFDVYGTLLLAPPGAVQPDPAADPALREILLRRGHAPPPSPSTSLHQAVLRHHAASCDPFPEVDLRRLWREVLGLPAACDTAALVRETEAAWHPASIMPGAGSLLRQLARSGMVLGLLSNAQCHTRACLGPLAGPLEPDLCLLSYQHGIAKPSPALFALLRERLSARGIAAAETLYAGNDPLQDIRPASLAGFRTCLFAPPGSLRPGSCDPDLTVSSWPELLAWLG